MVLDVYEPQVEDLIDPEEELEPITDGFEFTEGPVWDPAQGCLYFSDVTADTIYRYCEGEGAQVYRQPSNHANGLALDREGRLVACEHETRRVTRTVGDQVEVVVDHYQGKRLNSPNDVVVASDGAIWFTDPPFGLLKALGGSGSQQLRVRGVYRVLPGANEPSLMIDDFRGPNGLAFSPDESRLYVDDTVRGYIRAFDVGPEWALSGGDVLVELVSPEEAGVPDGLKVDARGNIYCVGPGGIWICAPDGTLLGRIRMPELAANLGWGDADRRSLYVTAATGLYRVRCRVGGVG